MEAVNQTSDALIARILDDAEKEAARITSEANENAAAVRREGEKRISALRAEANKQREQAGKDMLDGCRTRAELSGRKLTLSAKRALLDKVYEQAYARLAALAGQQRDTLLLSLIRREAQDGDTLVPAAADRDTLTKLIPSAGVSVTLSGDAVSADGGFLLLGRGYEKDCTFRAVMAEAWTDAETETAAMLFS